MEKISIEENFKLEDIKNVEKIGKLFIKPRWFERIDRYSK